MPSERSRLHLDYLDGVRALAAVSVVMAHAGQRVIGKHPAAGWQSVVYSMASYSHLSVGVFICLSGFCLMLPVLRNGDRLRGGAREFFERRAIRILPPYYLAFALSAIAAIWLVHDHTFEISTGSLVSHLLLYQNVVGPNSVNPVFWSIAVECQIYLLFPLFIRAWHRSPVRATSAMVVGSFLVSVSLAIVAPSLLSITPQYVALFAIGAFAAAVCVSERAPFPTIRAARIPWASVSSIGFVAFALMVPVIGWRVYGSIMVPTDFIWGVLAAAFLIAAFPRATGRNSLSRVLSVKPLRSVGLFAYSIYLIHMPVIEVLNQHVVQRWHVSTEARVGLMELAGVPVAVVVAYGFYLACERPFIAMRRPARRVDVHATDGGRVSVDRGVTETIPTSPIS